MGFLRFKKTVVVHSGNFHADDVFSVATLFLYLGKKIKIIRTRDQNEIENADYILDVGRIFDPSRNMFDHHQEGGVGKRENGIPYATFGLLWREYGEKICGSVEGQKIIEQKLVLPMDADDNALEISNDFLHGIKPYTISECINDLNSISDDQDKNYIFKKLVNLAMDIIRMEVKIANRYLIDYKKVEEIYLTTQDKRIIVLDQDYDWNGILSNHPEPLFVIKPSPSIKSWKVYAIKINEEKFKNRLDLPQSWASKEGEDFVKISGVKDAVFCHHQRYMAIVKSKEGAIQLAKLAIESKGKSL